MYRCGMNPPAVAQRGSVANTLRDTANAALFIDLADFIRLGFRLLTGQTTWH